MLIILGAFIWYRRLRKQGGPPGSHGDTKAPKIEYPHVNVDYGTGPVTPHTPSLPKLRSPSPPASLVLSVSSTETDSDPGLHGNFTSPSASSRTRLVLHTYADQSSAPASVAGSSEFGRGGSEGRRESSPPLYPPTVTSGGDSSAWNSGQVEYNLLPPYDPSR